MTILTSSISDITKKVDGNLNKDTDKLQYSEKKIKQQKMQFFSLLAQQLKNQDPTAPMDTNQMMAQMIGLTGVEQQLSTNQYLEQIKNQLFQQGQLQAANNIGKEVEYQGNNFKYQGTPVELKYEFDKTVNNAKLNILNSNQDVIFSEDIDGAAGKQKYHWSGLDWRGNPALPGTYSFEVLGDYKDQNVAASTIAKGVIESVMSNSKGGTDYMINGKEVDPAQIKQISGANKAA